MKRYPDLPASPGELEEHILARWSAEDTFGQSVERCIAGRPFVFYEGPPTANGKPGIHHVLSRTIKDAIARFRTMEGRYVPRIAGWDTHGLPVEIEAERRLGISGKPEIEKVGIARFNEVCRESVLTYTEEWERFSARIGYWLDYSNPYVTYHADYIESVWWSLKQIAERGLFYRGHKILPYCPRCGTGLSSHEVAQGYRDVLDPSLYLTMELADEEGFHLLVWTTTPWTLVSNVALAINAEIEYAEVVHDGRRLVLAGSRVAALLGEEAEVVRTLPGSELLDRPYRRPFDWVKDEGAGSAWRVTAADFVSDEEGTGIVHIAPAYGADDYALGQSRGLPVFRPVDDRGLFDAELPEVGGVFVKEADARLVALLKERGRVFRYSRESHSYPHCWRCGSPLIYMARDSWFIRTTAVRDELLANNAMVGWFPSEIGSGRFGEWLENNVDWAISRNRYWGTPLPAWVCDRKPEHIDFIGSFEELRARMGDLPEAFDPHRPFIDELSWPCTDAACEGHMNRTPEVIDVWYDSGAMPFAQWHYPFENRTEGEKYFPADFICEGVDQTRGWFYSLLAISTLLGRGPAFRNVIVNDLILDAEGQKMSKSKGNVVDPWAAIGANGADAIRWYLLASSHPWLPKRFDSAAVREVQRKVFDTLRNTYNFFALYANLEEWADGEGDPAPEERPLMDRWLLSRLAELSERVTSLYDGYNLTHAVRELGDFIVDDLSNWYVRRSRDRFWGSSDSADTRAAFATLHRALVDASKLMAPVAPFLADWLHRALTDESVHLGGLPEPAIRRDEELEAGMEAVRRLSTLGRAAREQVKIKVRQPLGTLYAVLPPGVGMEKAMLDILRDELNVRTVEFIDAAENLVTFRARPNFRALGARFGKETPAIAERVRGLSSQSLAAFRGGAPLEMELADGRRVRLEEGELEISQEATGDFVVEADGGYTVALDPTITAELRAEGLARELVSRVQRLRKDSGLEVADRIRIGVAAGADLRDAFQLHREFIMGETLALDLQLADHLEETAFTTWRQVDLEDIEITIGVARIAQPEAV